MYITMFNYELVLFMKELQHTVTVLNCASSCTVLKQITLVLLKANMINLDTKRNKNMLPLNHAL